MPEQYLSVSDFAAACGRSTQTIYKQLNNRLKPFVKVDATGKKSIDIRALELFPDIASCQPLSTVDNPVDNRLIELYDARIADLQKQIEGLTADKERLNRDKEQQQQTINQYAELLNRLLPSPTVQDAPQSPETVTAEYTDAEQTTQPEDKPRQHWKIFKRRNG